MRRLTVIASVLAMLAVAPSSRATTMAPTDVRAALDAQARALGLSDGAVVAPVHGSLREAVRAYVGSKGGLTAEVESRLAALDGLPAVKQTPLTRLVDGFIAFDAAAGRRHSLAHDQLLADLLAARAALFDAANTFPDPGDAPADVTSTSPLAVPPWFSLSMGVNDDTYETDIALLIDEGGNDVYLNNAGGSNLVGGSPCELAAVIPSPAAALIDQGGSDQYISGRSCGANGGGAALRAGFLYDGGDEGDTFSAGSFGVNGGGDFGGVGFLFDEAGDTSYLGGSNGVNGGGSAGIGLLVDGGGADSYDAADRGANGGGQLGAGGLLDQGAGADDYRAGDAGTNGGGNGGTGFLIDLGGDDSYTAGSNGVNGGGSGGAGVLLDASGLDVYADGDGGSGTNKTVPVKGAVGTQIDVP